MHHPTEGCSPPTVAMYRRMALDVGWVHVSKLTVFETNGLKALYFEGFKESKPGAFNTGSI